MEDHEIIRVGGTHPKEIDVRVIVATNKNLEDLIAVNRFRKDLYYRLNVVPIHILPLRERRDDILPLIFHFLGKFNKICNKEKILSPETMEALFKYNFPGNIRELANIIERLVVITEKEQIEARDLPNVIIDNEPKVSEYSFLTDEIPLRVAMER